MVPHTHSNKWRFTFQTFTDTPAATPSLLGFGITHQTHEGGDGAKYGAKFADTPCVIYIDIGTSASQMLTMNPRLVYPQIEATNNSIATTKAGAFNAAPGGFLVEVTLRTRPATKRITGSTARVSTIKGVNPG